MPIRRQILASAAALATITLLPAARAQSGPYPNRPIKLVVPYAVGGGSDAFARTVSPRLGEILGQPLIIENKPGAGTAIGAAQVAKAPPDGYTLLQGDNGTYAVNKALYKSLPYDPVTDFAHVTLTARFGLLVAVHPSVPAKTLGELLDYARSRQLSYGSPGTGSPHHLAMELLLRRAHVAIQHVPYKGAGPALQDLLSGQIPIAMLDVATASQHAKSGAVRIIALGNAERLAALPDVPTVAEQGFAGYEASAWQGFALPAGTPRDVVQRINAAYQEVARDATIRRRLAELGAEMIPDTPEAMLAHVRAETTKWEAIVKAAGITVD